MIVYVDVLIVLNFIVNYLLLLISARLCAVRLQRLRMALAALVGGLASLVIFLPPMGPAASILMKAGLSALLALLAGGYHDGRGYLKRLLMLLTVSFVFAGFMLCLTLFAGGRAGFYQNGVCYFRISALQLLLYSVAAYVVLLAVQKVLKRGAAGDVEYRVVITADGRTGEFYGVMDSQNHLIDLFSGTPVVIGSVSLLQSILPPQVEAALRDPLEGARRGVRLIPCGTVAGQDLLPAFRPERMVLRGEAKELLVEDVYIAVAAGLDSAGMKKLILNPSLTGCSKLQKGGV